ncbi:minichromosome maintenance domain-containing protein 2 isoform X2 [Frankliniella occidentalis]|uniref:Minichromosome maintenance domain-containing protein 2 isoform X2 n=1 Tax=Frankliniella occidentalis TaxID=133901 RepID=A0A9C6TSI3_FRAOC|nr:minichromosome maintenance domain-containing protein 2 isoform X2 [Frankliniella occidentalis]
MEEYLDPPFEQEVRRTIVRHMDANGTLASLEQAGFKFKDSLEEYTEGKRSEATPPFIFPIPLDVAELAEISCEMGSLVLEKPRLVQELVRDVVHCALTTLCPLPALTLDQVQVALRVSSLPAERSLRTDGTKIPAPTDRRLLLLQGVAVAVTTPTKYTRSAVFRCPVLSCPGAAGVRVWGPKASRRRCRFCAGDADEAPRGRDVGDQVEALLVRPDALQAAEAQEGRPNLSHPTLVRFCDDLALPETLQLGQRYDVVVLSSGLAGPAEAWGVRPWVDGALRRVARGLRSDPLPGSIQGVWVEASADTESPWAFAVTLASQVGGDRYPAHTFLHLKLGILLSLASQGLDHPPVPLLAVGRDPAGQVLLARGARLADRAVCITSAADLTRLPAAPALPRQQQASRGRAGPAGAWLSAGPLVLARGGICFVGSWDKWNRSSASAITAALESGKAVLECRDLAGAQLPGAGPSVPLQCAVWAYWSPPTTSKPSDLLTLRTLLNTLGAPVLAETGSEEEAFDICEHLLIKARREQMSSVVLDSDMKEFLTLVNAQPVALTDEASRLIRDYFVASRRVRPNCLPVTAVGTIYGRSFG